MIRAIRTQVDGKGDKVSAETVVDCSNDIDRTRQEYKEEADINYILNRFGVIPRDAVYGHEIDYDIDLQRAIENVQDVRLGYDRLPEHIKMKYPSWINFTEALERGEITRDLFNPPADDKPLSARERAIYRRWSDMRPSEKERFPSWRSLEDELARAELDNSSKTSSKEDSEPKT